VCPFLSLLTSLSLKKLLGNLDEAVEKEEMPLGAIKGLLWWSLRKGQISQLGQTVVIIK